MTNLNDNLWFYKATVVDVYDGDTVRVVIDQGFNDLKGANVDGNHRGVSLRLHGINTPEVRGEQRPQGLISRNWLRDQVLNKEIIIQTIKDKTGKYGRYLVILYKDNLNLNEELVKLGLAEHREY